MNEITGRDFGRLEGKVDQLLDLHREAAERHEKLDDRVSKVEHKQSYAAGKSTVYGALAGGLIGFLSKYLVPPGS